MKHFIAFLLILASFLPVDAQLQSNAERANQLTQEAIELMDNGKIAESLELLNQALKIDPDNINVSYEMIYAYYLMEDYKHCVEVAKPLLKHPDVFDQVYQMIGNSYDLLGKPAKAIKYYNKGIQKFPGSGRLYLEKGIVLANQNKLPKALEAWEAGIVADPDHSSNYYYASQMFAQTNEKIWGIYYGEIFLNLEPLTERSKFISKQLYDLYEECLSIQDSKWIPNFSEKATTINMSSLKNFKLSFETVHSLDMSKACQGLTPEFNIQNLVKIRKQFLAEWNINHAERYPNVIFEWHNELSELNYLEPYLFWLFKEGAKDEYNQWVKSNTELFDKFMTWFYENRMMITPENSTHRFSYD